jgi:hypothetical protein
MRAYYRKHEKGNDIWPCSVIYPIDPFYRMERKNNEQKILIKPVNDIREKCLPQIICCQGVG